MRLTCNNILLLLASQVDELHSVTRYTDGEVSVFRLLGMLHSIEQFVNTKHIHVQVVCTLGEVTVHHANQRVSALLVVLAQGVGADGLSIRDTVEGILVRQLCY